MNPSSTCARLPSTRSALVRLRGLGVCLFLLGAAFTVRPARGAEVTPVWIATSTQVAAGSTTGIWLNYLNPTGASVTREFPAKLGCKIHSTQSELARELTLRHPSEAGSAVIPPGGFARREYAVELPAELVGKVWLTIEQAGANQLVLESVPAILAAKQPDASTTPTNGAKLTPPISPSDPVDYFKKHFFPHEPIYFIAGTGSPNTKFQISFKYQLFLSDGWMVEHAPALTNLFAGYTQTSLWDLDRPSAPFFDSSYKPELLYSTRVLELGQWFDWCRLEVAGGLQHESNGRDGPSSRGLNLAYLQPSFIFGEDDGFQVILAPRGWVYLSKLKDNPDIGDYRGHVELHAVAGWTRHLEFSALLRAGDTLSHGSAELGLSYPLGSIPMVGSTVFLYAQYFTGYGESLVGYNQRSSIFRAGFSLFR